MVKKKYYPVCLDVAAKRCVVAGGGKVACRKAVSLLEAGARVTVISPVRCEKIAEMAKLGRVKYIKTAYSSRFLKNAGLVIAATDDGAVNRKISAAAHKRKIPVNVVDAPALSSFIVPAVLRRGRLTVSVSTSGADPFFAKCLKKTLAKFIGPEYGPLLEASSKKRTAGRNVKNRNPGGSVKGIPRGR